MRKVIDLNNFSLKMVWDHEANKWFYFPSDILLEQLSTQYVIHEVRVVSGIIISDTFDKQSVGKCFKDYYSYLKIETLHHCYT